MTVRSLTDGRPAHPCGPCRRDHHTKCAGQGCTCEHDDSVDTVPAGAAAPGYDKTWPHPKPALVADPLPDGFAWEEPPADGRGRSGRGTLRPAVVALLATNPGKWAKVRTYDRPTSALSAKTRLRKQPPAAGRWEWRAVKLTNGGSILWGRCLGESVGQG